MTSFRIGDVVLHQFTRDWQLLSVELHQLEMQKGQAVSGPKDFTAIQRIEARTAKLADVFERQRTLFEASFQGDWVRNADVLALRRVLNEIASLIPRILGLGHPDRGKGLLSKSVSDFQKKLEHAEGTYKASIGVNQPMITMPEVPAALTGNPILAIAILLDLLRMLVTQSKKPK